MSNFIFIFIFIFLKYYLIYSCYYLGISLHFFVLFIDFTVLFQLLFSFIYSIFSKFFFFNLSSISCYQRNSKIVILLKSLFILLFSLFLLLFISPIVFFGIIQEPHRIISTNFYFYIPYFQHWQNKRSYPISSRVRCFSFSEASIDTCPNKNIEV